MGTGPFLFVEHGKGSHWVGKKTPAYWDKGKPYLDGYRATFVSSSSAQVAAVRGERAHIQFRGFSPADRDSLVSALGNKITVQESPWDCILMVAMNHGKKPFDKRVRCALTLARTATRLEGALQDRHRQGSGGYPRRTPWATPPDELAKLAGYGRDINASRAEAKRLLKEAGVEGLSFTFKNRGIPQPYEPTGIWLIDQWRQVGITVKQEIVEASTYYSMLRSGDFEAAMDFQCGFIVEPDLDLPRFLSDSTPTTASPTTRSSTTSSSSRRAPPTPRSARSTCAPSRSGCSTRRCTRS
jgi:peptide/nickel transport system substrate-binding protein